MSTEVTTAQMNYVIGVFDGKSFMGSHITDYCADTAPKMKYHTDWGLLMRVIEKLKDRLYEIWNSSQIYEQPQIEISLNTNTIKLVDVETGWYLIDPISKETLKETVYHACYEIIKWLNQQKQTNDERGTNKG